MLSLVMKIASTAEKITLLANARYVFYSAIVTTCTFIHGSASLVQVYIA